MNNKRRRQRQRNGQAHPPRSRGETAPRLTTGNGAQPYDEETMQVLARLVPGVEIIQPLGLETEFDEDRLSRARAMANAHQRIVGAPSCGSIA